MASLIKKKKGNRLYYYLVESARVDGQPRIVHQAYLGTAEKLAELVQQKSAPVPLSATLRDFGLPGALWLAAKQSGLWPLLESLWPAPRSGPGPAHYLLLAAIHRICDPGPKTEVSDWYDRTILASEWGFPAERFTSQAFWDAFEQILPETSATLAPAEDPLDQAQLRLLGLWKEKQLVGRWLLAYDTTNFYTYIASTNTRNQLAQRGHNKQGRHNLRQVGLSYVLDGESGLSLCHHVYPGNVADVEEFSVALARIVRLLDQNQIARDTVTLVFDKGTAALDNTVQLQESVERTRSKLPLGPLQPGREHELNPQPRESRRIPVPAPLSGPSPPHLYSQQTVRAWERDRDGQQHRRARVALPSGNRRRPAHRDHGYLPHPGSVPAAQGSGPGPRSTDGDPGESDGDANLLPQHAERRRCPPARAWRRFPLRVRQTAARRPRHAVPPPASRRRRCQRDLLGPMALSLRPAGVPVTLPSPGPGRLADHQLLRLSGRQLHGLIVAAIRGEGL